MLLVAVLATIAVVVAVLVWTTASTDDPDGPIVALPAAAPKPPSTDGLPDRGWVRETAKATDIPRRAVTAYARAALRVGADDGDCRIAWNTLAGIGASESSHGSFGGARLGKDGVVSKRIVGIALDGDGVAAVRDTDAGRLDGDTTWDRAVGPLQFIPATWGRWGADGDGDGTKDPQDIDDAALAAARYLCDAGGDLGEASGWSRAVLTYNRSTAYAQEVARTATSYAEAL